MIPAIRIEVDGKPARSEFRARLASVVMIDSAGVEADTLEIELDARGNPDVPSLGTELRLWLGYEPVDIYQGRFKVSDTEFSGPPARLLVRATSADFTSAIKEHRRGSYHEATVSQIVEEIAARHSLTPVVDTTLGGRLIPHIDQQNESDASFLTRLARRQGATFKLAAGRLIFAQSGSPLLANDEAKQIFTVRPPDVSDYSFRREARGDYKSASAEWFNRSSGQRENYRTGTEKPHYRDGILYGSEGEAKAAAEANLGYLRRGARTAEFTAPGMPALYAEARVKMADFWHAADGEYSVVSVTHTINGSGFTTSVELEGFEVAGAA